MDKEPKKEVLRKDPVQLSRYGAFLHAKETQGRSRQFEDRKKKADKNACRGKGRSL